MTWWPPGYGIVWSGMVWYGIIENEGAVWSEIYANMYKGTHWKRLVPAWIRTGDPRIRVPAL